MIRPFFLIQGFELMASQLRGKLEAGGSRSFHHGETHKTIHFEEFYDWLNGFRNNKLDVNSLRNNQQSTSIEETKEPPSFVGDEAKQTLHQEDRKSLPSDFEKHEEKSHDNEEEYLENIEYHSETHSTVDMDQRESIDGCLNCEGVPIDGCSKLCVGDIEIIFENGVAIKTFNENKY